MNLQQPELVWRKASASKAIGNCVELALLPDGHVAMRNSNDPSGPMLRFPAAELAVFMKGYTVGEFDDLTRS
jgi:hypothetical protein